MRFLRIFGTQNREGFYLKIVDMLFDFQEKNFCITLYISFNLSFKKYLLGFQGAFVYAIPENI